MTRTKVTEIISHLELEPHVEGGFFHQVYKSRDQVITPERFIGEKRAAGSHIYYLLVSPDFSTWHRLKADELWHYYEGENLVLYVLEKNGDLRTHHLGPLSENMKRSKKDKKISPTVLIPAEHWFAVAHEEALRTSPSHRPNLIYTLAGCTVMPGFEDRDFELADVDDLVQLYPQHHEVILRFTREEVAKQSSNT